MKFGECVHQSKDRSMFNLLLGLNVKPVAMGSRCVLMLRKAFQERPPLRQATGPSVWMLVGILIYGGGEIRERRILLPTWSQCILDALVKSPMS